jgi:hypothetical protein
VAYVDFIRTVHTDRSVVYQHPERLCRTLKHLLFSFFSPLGSLNDPRTLVRQCSVKSAALRITFDDVILILFRSDVSWGTKGDNKVSTDLGVVKASKGDNAVEVAVPTAEKDINAAYEDAIHVLSTKPPKEEKKVDAATEQEDFYRNFRTKCVWAFFLRMHRFYNDSTCSVLLAWVLSNVSVEFVFFLCLSCVMRLKTLCSAYRHCWSPSSCKCPTHKHIR